MLEAVQRFGLPQATVQAIQAVLSRHPGVVRAVVYGSRAKGTFRPGSDIDLALFGDGLTGDDLLSIDVEIDDLDLPYMVDLSLFAQIENAALRSHIERVGQDLYRRAAVKAG